MNKLSLVISAFNEATNITACLQSISWADEIILIDNQSSDQTVALAKKVAKKNQLRVFSRPNNPLMLNLNKNYGFTKATNDWILSLDADERVSRALKQEITQVLSIRKNSINGYFLPRKNIIFGQWIQHGLWYPDYQLRLFKKGQGKFPGVHNHELAVVNGPTEKLKHHLIHYNYQSVSQYLQKIDRQYSDNEVKNFLESGKKLHWSDALRFPVRDFITNFFARSSYKDGLHGLVLSILQAFYSFIVFAKIWEQQKFWRYDHPQFLKQTKQEMEQLISEIKYWQRQKAIESSRLLKRILLKLFRVK